MLKRILLTFGNVEFNLKEKALIRTSHENRSVEDRKKLVHLLAGLPCFAIIPPVC